MIPVYAIRYRTRETMLEVAVHIARMRSSAFDTARALIQAQRTVAELHAAVGVLERLRGDA